jgi:rhamnulokinase
LPFNSLYQLQSVEIQKLEKTKTLLLMVDYLTFRLTGHKVYEYTNATTTQLMNHQSRQFDDDLLELAGLSKQQVATLVQPKTKYGL